MPDSWEALERECLACRACGLAVIPYQKPDSL